MIISKNSNSILLQCDKGSTENYKRFLTNKEKLWIKSESNGYTQTAVITIVNNKNNTFVLKVTNYDKLDKKSVIAFLKASNINVIKELSNW